MIACVSSFCREIILSTAEAQAVPRLDDHPEIKVVIDTIPGKGPLGGIYAGLATSKSFCNLVVACDMPFLNRNLLNYMLQLSGGFDMVAPRVGDYVEPLHAVYTKSCLTPIESMIKQDNLSVHKLLQSVKVRYVETEEINRFDPAHLSFFNINTDADLEKARKLAGEHGENDQC